MPTLDPDSIWSLTTDPRFNRPARPAPAYLTRTQALRWHRITQARLLYEGHHYRFYVQEQRSAYEFPPTVVDGTPRPFYVKYNLLKRISHTSADMLYGNEPLVRVDDEVQAAKLKAFADRTDFHALLVDKEVECSFAAEAVVEACIFDDEVYVVLIPAEQIHPIGELRPDRQYAAYVRYAESNVGTDETAINLILQTTYREGAIERHLYQEEVRPEREVELKAWPAFAAKTPPAVEETGIPFNTIVWFPNLMLAGRVVSDYDDLIELQDTLNHKNTRLASVLDKHSRPKVVAPRAAADENGDLRADSDVLYSDSPDEWRYLTWDAQIDAADRDRAHTIDTMCVVSETSPVLLGLDKGGVPDSARAMKLKAATSVSKAQRKATLRRPLVRWLLNVVQLLEQTIPGNRYDVAAPLSVEMRDGLPTDEGELITNVVNAVSGSVMSIERAVELQIPDRAAAAQEVARIKAEAAERAAAATPHTLLGEPASDTTDTNNTADAPSTEAA